MEVVEKGSASTKVSKSIRILQMSLLDLQIVYVHGSASELGMDLILTVVFKMLLEVSKREMERKSGGLATDDGTPWQHKRQRLHK